MVKLYTSLLSLTLATSLALAAPYPSYTDGHDYYNRDLLERALDEEISRREYILKAFEDLAAREPSFWNSITNAAKDVGRVAVNGLHIAEKVAANPLVEAAASVIPGGAAVEKVIGTLGKIESFAEKAQAAGQKVRKFEGSLGGKVKKVDRAISRVKQTVSAHNPIRRIPGIRRHRRDLEEIEELSRRDLDSEELFEREYDDFLAERDYFDDLD